MGSSIRKAIELILSADPELLNILSTTARVCLTSSVFALLIGVPVGILFGAERFPRPKGAAGVQPHTDRHAAGGLRSAVLHAPLRRRAVSEPPSTLYREADDPCAGRAHHTDHHRRHGDLCGGHCARTA